MNTRLLHERRQDDEIDLYCGPKLDFQIFNLLIFLFVAERDLQRCQRLSLARFPEEETARSDFFCGQKRPDIFLTL